MNITVTDYNDANKLFAEAFVNEWAECEHSLRATDLHLKASDQKGKIGSSIFDPVGTNYGIKHNLMKAGWKHNLDIPREFSFLGTDVDFEKNGIIGEVQFSNYPFLLNNILRSELFFSSGTILHEKRTAGLIYITKAGKFPSSNSTLYYEQAKSQLDSFSKYGIFKIPVRLVGLFPELNKPIEVKWTKYDKPRYSRTIEEQTTKSLLVMEDQARYIFKQHPSTE